MECCSCFLLAIIFLMTMFDVFYYLRMISTIIYGRLFQKRFKINDKVTVYGVGALLDISEFREYFENLLNVPTMFQPHLYAEHLISFSTLDNEINIGELELVLKKVLIVSQRSNGNNFKKVAMFDQITLTGDIQLHKLNICSQGFCFTQDLDLVFKHMNNARFLRDLDFVRFHFYDRTGLYEEIVKRKSDALQAATNIRYRRVIPIFSVYRIETQLIYWEDRSFYLEHKFITNDDFIRAIILSKSTMKGSATADDIMKSLNAGENPSPTPDLELWIRSMEASSEKLKADKKTD